MPLERYFIETGLTPEEQAKRERLKSYLAPSGPQYSTSVSPETLEPNEFLQQMTGQDIPTAEVMGPPRAPAASPSPPTQSPVVEYLKNKYNKPAIMGDDEAIIRADEAADDQKMRSGIGMGIQQIIAGIGNQPVSSKYEESQLVGADKKAQAVRDYLQNKIKNERDSALLQETLRHNRALEGLNAQKINQDIETARGQRATTMGTAATEDDAKKAKEFAEAYQNYTGMIDRLHGLRKKHGGEAYGPIAAEMENLSTNALLEFKKMAVLGNLSGSDIALVEKALGDVTSHLSSTESVLSRLSRERKNADQKLESFAKVRGLDPSKVKTQMKPLEEDEKEKAIDEEIIKLQAEINRMKAGNK